jgi:pectinesterase
MRTSLIILAIGTLFFSCRGNETEPAIPEWDFVVAADGSGDFIRIQEAIDAVPHLRANRTVIFIKKGVYKEKLMLPSTKTNITFLGEAVEETILTWDDYASKKNSFGENMGTSGSASFFIYGDGFEAYNLTFENSSGPVGQAVAVRVDGDKVKFENCRFLGFQDTLYLHGDRSRQYYKNCYIEGTVDFIFGSSTAVFDNCEIYCKKGGYITAASTPEQRTYGMVFLNCKISTDAEKPLFYLGRPWRNYAKTVFLNCFLDAHIRPEGWHNWNKPEAEQTTFYAEYNSYGPGANPASRVSWSHNLSPDQAAAYTPEGVLGDWIKP